jgi:hypothetical protein
VDHEIDWDKREKELEDLKVNPEYRYKVLIDVLKQYSIKPATTYKTNDGKSYYYLHDGSSLRLTLCPRESKTPRCFQQSDFIEA